MNTIKKVTDLNLNNDWINFEKKIRMTAPSFYRKIEYLKLAFIQKRLVVLIKLDFDNKQIREILNLDKLSYLKCVEQTKQEMKLLNCFSLRIYLKML